MKKIKFGKNIGADIADSGAQEVYLTKNYIAVRKVFPLSRYTDSNPYQTIYYPKTEKNIENAESALCLTSDGEIKSRPKWQKSGLRVKKRK